MSTTQKAEEILGASIEAARAQLDALAFALYRARTQVDLASKDPLHEKLGRIVCDKFGVTREELFSWRRPVHIISARQCLYALMNRCGMTPHAIGRAIDRNHVTITHGIKAWREHLETEPAMRRIWDEIMRVIEPQFLQGNALPTDRDRVPVGEPVHSPA